MNATPAHQDWAWPIIVDSYDRSVGLTEAERVFLVDVLPTRVKCSRTQRPDFTAVRRLIRPIEDVFDYIGYCGPKRPGLLIYLLEAAGARRRSLWGWTEEEWIAAVNERPYDANVIIAVAFMLCALSPFNVFKKRKQVFFRLAIRVFGKALFAGVVQSLASEMHALGYKPRTTRTLRLTLAQLLLSVRSPHIEDLTPDLLAAFQRDAERVAVEKCLIAISRVLAARGNIETPLRRLGPPRWMDGDPEVLLANVPAEWARLARYWHDTSTLGAAARLRHYYRLLCVGRWLSATHPEITSPAEWTRSLAAESIAMLTAQRSGEWSHLPCERIRNFGQPMSPQTKMSGIVALRTFFRDLQQWEIISLRFEPYRTFTPPRSIRNLIDTNPRIIADDVWAKLMWAGLNVADEDLSKQGHGAGASHYYPFLLVRAMALVWLFAGLRWNEIRRLRIGCIRWQEDRPGERVCLLSVPTNKTGSAFTKPVDRMLGEAIEQWQEQRPPQAKQLDSKTGERVDYLFLFRYRLVGYQYVNHVLIPTLCEKAGVPTSDVLGKITSHRGRSTIATQLFNAREPLSLFELQEWLGHKSPSSTQHYAKISPTKLMRAYAKAGYFERNVRAIEVLIDQEVVWQGLGTQEPWKFFDLGHGYCTYNFFDQCPHRMACAKCSFYVPKESTRAQILEGKANLLRLRQEIPLTEPEVAAVDEGVTAYEKLLESLAGVPAPDGQTRRQLVDDAVDVRRIAKVPT